MRVKTDTAARTFTAWLGRSRIERGAARGRNYACARKFCIILLRMNRRDFNIGVGVLGLGTLAPRTGRAAPGVSYPAMDLGYFDKPITLQPHPIAFGYAGITWKDAAKQGITDIAQAGF